MSKRSGIALTALVLVAGLVYVAWNVRENGKDGAGKRGTEAGTALSSELGAVTTTLAPAITPMALPSTSASSTGAFATFGWGGGDGQLGRSRPQEANPEGPMSLAADGKGGALLLDQVNGRVVRVDADGKPKGTIKVPLLGAQDVAVASDGTVAVLDRLADKQVQLFGADGKPRGSLPLEGKGIAEGGAVTGVFVDGDKVYAEKEHGALVLLGGTDGKPGDRTEIPGRPSRDGTSYISAGITTPDEGRLWVTAITRATNQHRFTRELRMGVPVPTLLLLDSDKSGTIYLAMEAMPSEGNPVVLLSCLAGKDGAPIGTVQLPASVLPEETFREFAVLDQGGVLHAEMTEGGVVYRKYDCR
ncbi:MAG TPA: hypothetical protein VF316_11670 [Polyangiaceae bacterium]